MPIPKSVTKFKKDGFEFVSSVDRAKYTMIELSRAALRDVGKLVRKRIIAKQKTLPGLGRSRWPYYVTGYWVRKRETDLQIGFGNSKRGGSGDVWYAIRQELGSSGRVGKNGARAYMPRKAFMRDTVFESIDDIMRIEGQYLSAIENENKALGLIKDEGDIQNREDGPDD